MNAQLLDKAIQLAAYYHRGQVDKGGMPYIMHPIAVAASLPADDWEGRVVAVLHDVIEDTHCSLRLLDLDFPVFIVDVVNAISKRAGETNREYWARCKANPIAARVKVADMAHNASVERIRVLPYDQQEYLTKKYEEARMFFADVKPV